MDKDLTKENESLSLLDTNDSKEQESEKMKLTEKQKVFLVLLFDPECAEIVQKFVKEVVNEKLNETKKLDKKNYDIMVNSMKAVVNMVDGWEDILKLCKQKFEKVTGTPFLTTLQVPKKELESVKKYLKSLTEPDVASKNLLLQQSTSVAETFLAETQPKTISFIDILTSWIKETLKADENSKKLLSNCLQEPHQVVDSNDQPSSSKRTAVTKCSNQPESMTSNLISILEKERSPVVYETIDSNHSESKTRSLKSILEKGSVVSEIIDLTVDSDDEDDSSRHDTDGNQHQETNTNNKAENN